MDSNDTINVPNDDAITLDLEVMLDQVAEAIGSDRDVDVAEALGVARSTISTWRRREYLPMKEVAIFGLKRGIPIESLLVKDAKAKKSALYENEGDALDAVLEAQAKLGLVFSAAKLKVVLSFAVQAQATIDEICDFIRKAHKLAGVDLPTE